ncbi:guanylate kinase [Oceanivirga miroungae]|uniref:Guanylate kinase n=1 Tax=Oceanivirga miroungae TaxID=1130046 RepID=A0A6I8M7J3_9FUSO|nr:guanylate kinase [Oceanivirga miroungae]VWL85427.1 guanylate kinase [Oceanivirga miroungae]
MKGKLFVVSGPSGSGKSTITKIVRDKLNIPLSISATSRKSRPGEVNGVDYYFLTEEEFSKKIENNEFFEYANVHGNYYGTLVSEINSKLDNGQDVILEIDVQGAIISKNKYDDIVLIFCKTENDEVLRNRLLGRNTDSNEVIEKRLNNAKKELEYEKYYDYTIINKNLDDSVNKLIKIIKGEYNEKE